MLLTDQRLHDALDAVSLDTLPEAEALRSDAHALLREFAAADMVTVAGIRRPAAWAAAALHRVGQRSAGARPTLSALAEHFGVSFPTVAAASRRLEDAVPERQVKRARAGDSAGSGTNARAGADALYQFKVTLRNVRPPVWRRIVTPGRHTLAQLHDAIQAAMGWENYHLFSFDGRGVSYTDAETIEELGDGEDARRVRVHQAFPAPRAALLYTYDFGDNWEHEVRLERILPTDARRTRATCLEGAGACPPEDCGGPWSYQELRQILADPAHDEHDSYREWLGLEPGEPWDTSTFDLTVANRALRRGD